MLIISYGLQKSGSTYCFQLTCDIVEAAGFRQRELRERFLPPECRSGFMRFKDYDVFALAEALPADQMLVIKTHSPCPDPLRAMLKAGTVKATASFRDPRDAAVAVMDAGARDRAAGRRRSFDEVFTAEQAINLIAGNLLNLRSWVSDEHVLRLPYNKVTRATRSAVHDIARHLGVSVDAGEIIGPYESGTKAIGEFNKGVPGRHKAAFTKTELAYAESAFSRFDKMLKGLGAW